LWHDPCILGMPWLHCNVPPTAENLKSHLATICTICNQWPVKIRHLAAMYYIYYSHCCNVLYICILYAMYCIYAITYAQYAIAIALYYWDIFQLLYVGQDQVSVSRCVTCCAAEQAIRHSQRYSPCIARIQQYIWGNCTYIAAMAIVFLMYISAMMSVYCVQWLQHYI